MPSFMTNADRIVGGQDAPSPIPWQVSVQIGYWHFCGATILDESTLLSAAHCFYESSAWDLSIRAGSVKKGNGGQVRPRKSTHVSAHNSRVSNIESDNSQNVGLEDYNNISVGIFPYFTTPSIKITLG